MILAAIITLSVVWAFVNGLQDAPNALTTTIITKTLPEHAALIYGAVLNMAGVLVGVGLYSSLHLTFLDLFGLPDFLVDARESLGIVLLCTLVTAISWMVLAWWFGMNVSGWSAALAGLAGAMAGVGAGAHALPVIALQFIPIIASPLLGFGLSYLMTRGVQHLRSESLVGLDTMRGTQVLTAGFVAAAHGLSNGRIPMGFIMLALVTSGGLDGVPGAAGSDSDVLSSADAVLVPLWLILLVTAGMGLGTYMGGHRIMYVLGRRLTALTLPQGLAAEASTAGLMTAAIAGFGVPVSSSQTICGSIVGSAVAVSRRSVAWPIAARIVLWWIATPLACAGVSGSLAWAVSTGA